jgi:hypothetical protein
VRKVEPLTDLRPILVEFAKRAPPNNSYFSPLLHLRRTFFLVAPAQKQRDSVIAVTHRCAHALPLRFKIIELRPKSIDAKPVNRSAVHGVRNMTQLVGLFMNPFPCKKRLARIRAFRHLTRTAFFCPISTYPSRWTLLPGHFPHT